MLSELFAASLSMFVLDPLHAELNERLPALQNQAQVASVVRECASAIGPHLLQKAQADYWWTTTTVIGVATGMIEPGSVLTQGPGSCRNVLSMLNGKATDTNET